MNSSVIGKGTHYLDVEMLGRVSKAGGTSCSDVIVQMMTYYRIIDDCLLDGFIRFILD